MNSVRIIKRGSLNVVPHARPEQTDQQSVRDIASTIKGWIVELEQRKRAEDRRYANRGK